MRTLARKTLPLALAGLLAAGCGETHETTVTPGTSHGASAASTDAQKGQDPMFGKKKDGLLAVGAAAPAFAVPDQEGNIVRLSDLAGKRVLIWFYPKADTPG